MKKVFILNVDSYDDWGRHMGTNIVGLYTTRELAEQYINNVPKTDVPTFDEYLATLDNVENISDEDREIMYSHYVYDVSFPLDEYEIKEYKLQGE
jgi:hypothetical protein